MITISKQKACQRFVYKIHSTRLRKAKWQLVLPLDEARKNDEVISIADSQVLRWIDDFNDMNDADAMAWEVKREIRQIRKEENSLQNRRKIRGLYAELDRIQYKQDYICLIIDKTKDYYRACKGFTINGIKYKRLLGTNGGIKNSTIVFVSERVEPMLKQRIENGRNPDVPLVTAKLEAYKALTCSASIPVSWPNGILVVPDCETKFTSDVIYLSEDDDGNPKMEHRPEQEIELDASDGFGMMTPALADRWSEELGLKYRMSGGNSRNAFLKGMVFTFDFQEFATEEAGGNYVVKDAWGDEVDVRNVELVLTTSMLKLWDSYSSCEDYVSKCKENGYTFGITKTCPAELENVHGLNYQFIQPYDLDDNDVNELIAPTMKEINDVLEGDWRKTVLFLKGSQLNDNNVDRLEDDIAKAIMVNHDMLYDPYIQKTVFELIHNRINDAKVGVLNVHGNYSIASGDPYALCQSIFGMQVTGLLKAGEIYNKYWCDVGSEKLVCFRAPMSAAENIVSVRPAHDDKTDHWYQYMNTCTIFNAWDTSMCKLNGMDKSLSLMLVTA